MTFWPQFRLKLRSKLLLVSLVLLLLPWLGARYLQAVEDLLQQAQAQSVATLARASSILVAQNAEPLLQRSALLEDKSSTLKVAVAAIDTPIHIDGYHDEWLPYLGLLERFPVNNQLVGGQKIDPQDVSARYIFTQRNDSLSLLLDVVDDSIIYRDASRQSRHGGDAIVLAVRDSQQRVYRYILSASAPGQINAYHYIGSYLEPVIIEHVAAIKAAWQKSHYGYRVEINLPPTMSSNTMAIAIVDVDDASSDSQVIGLGDVRDSALFSRLLLPSSHLSDVLSSVVQDGVRLWLVDQQANRMASAGYGDVLMSEPQLNSFSALFYQLFLNQPISDDESLSHEQAVLRGQAVSSALKNQAQTERRQTSQDSHVMIVAAEPVVIDGQVVGAIVAEQNTNAILLLQNEAVKTLLNTTLLVFAILVLILLGFASRLSYRIRRLNRDVANVVSNDGRLTDQFDQRVEYDELGELRSGFSQLFERLGHYTHYLEALASRLAHELRTPIAVIKTSLEHLDQHIDKRGKAYVERARTGSDRINDIVSRMSEASRLEQTINNIEFVDFDVKALLSNVIAVYRDIYTDSRIELNLPTDKKVMLTGSQELLVQMLDKLISNAVDFHLVNTPIVISLETKLKHCVITVQNTGQQLPDNMSDQLFQPMVSVRQDDNRSSVSPHLGLGLYIVKLAVETHGGKITVKNWQKGVQICVELPIIKL